MFKLWYKANLYLDKNNNKLAKLYKIMLKLTLSNEIVEKVDTPNPNSAAESLSLNYNKRLSGMPLHTRDEQLMKN